MSLSNTIKFCLIGALALGVAGCNTTTGATGDAPTSAAPAQLPPLEPQSKVFIRDAVAAGFIADTCPSASLKNASLQGMLTAQTRLWLKQGYTEQQIRTAYNSANKEMSPVVVYEYLKKLGVRQGDRASVCRVAARERARKTGIGQKLKG